MFYKLLFTFYLLALFSFLLFINLYYLEGIPHVPDSAAYLFMAKMFADGHIIMPIPVSPEHFNFFPGVLSVEKGIWLFQYPFGHPLLLSIGVLIGFPNVIPPIIGTLFILIVFLITKEVSNKRAAIFILILPFFSPFFLENASSFMSHNTAAFYLVVSLYCLIISTRKSYSKIYPLLTGIFLGLLFNTRPLTSLPFIAIFTLITWQKSKKIQSLFFLFLGLIIMFLLWLLYNYMTTGNALIAQYYVINKGMLEIPPKEISISFLKEHYKNFAVLFNNLGPMLFNWPIIITYGILIVPFLLKKNHYWDNIFFLCLFTLPFVYFFYNGQFLMYGPRFWYEILPFIFLLTARSLGLLYERVPKVTILFFVVLIFISFAKLFAYIPTTDPDMMSPLTLSRLRRINVIDSRVIKEIKKNNIHNAVVFIKSCGISWWCYGSVFPQNSPTLTSNIVYVMDLGQEKNQTIKDYFKGRLFYIIDYNAPQLEPIL